MSNSGANTRKLQLKDGGITGFTSQSNKNRLHGNIPAGNGKIGSIPFGHVKPDSRSRPPKLQQLGQTNLTGFQNNSYGGGSYKSSNNPSLRPLDGYNSLLKHYGQ